ncbi:MAG: YihY/virulence factor BrkB family protein [Flavobacteriaceae bacterium]|nr:YihY/virulence factor BrkB family protein [Flavobacteriaceae bacterium]
MIKIPIVSKIIDFLKVIKPPGFNGFSFYDLLEMYVIGIVKGTLSSRAGSISFSFFMALFPFLLFVLNLIPFIDSIIPIQNFDETVLSYMELFIPKETQGFFSDIFNDIRNKPRGGLLSSVFLLSVILTANGVSSIFVGFEVSYHVKLERNLFRQYIYALAVSVLLAFLLLMAFVIFFYFEFYILQNLNNLIPNEINWIRISQGLFFSFLTYISVSILYYFGTIEGRKTRFFSPGALMTTLLFLITTYGFGIYIDNFSTYNQLYGSIGALLIFLLYIWINATILLLGFELNATLSRLKSSSSGEGQTKEN